MFFNMRFSCSCLISQDGLSSVKCLTLKGAICRNLPAVVKTNNMGQHIVIVSANRCEL